MTVTLYLNNQCMQVSTGDNLFECAEAVGVRVPTSCQKNGKCRECMVEVVEGMEYLIARTDQEKHLKDHFRLACRANVVEGTGEIRCHTLRRGQMRIQSKAEGLKTSRTDLDPAVRQDGDQMTLDGKPIAQATGTVHGLAIDLGTTTVVIHLVDLQSGNTITSTSFENPQSFGGSDVMSRIQYDTDHKGRLLQRVLLGYLAHAIEELPCDPMTIYEVVVAGNATIRDMFFGLNVHTIGQRPYRSITEHEMIEGKRDTTSLTVDAKQLRLPIHPKARVYGLPLVSSHVGADSVACLLAIDMMSESRTIALMDIGTNTELIVGNKNRILAASCPAGPAFEGGGVSCGMPGLDGAIERVQFNDDGRISTHVIGDNTPEGICGSGLIELLSELRRVGRMDALGRLDDGDTHAIDIDTTHHLKFNEEDISQLAQAKGANIAGLQIVLKRYGIDFDELDRFYLAGGFAHHLNLEAARQIGLIPDLPDASIVQIGNASIEGATIALKSVTQRRKIEQFVKQIDHVELETDPDFFDHFTFGCQFKPVQTTAVPI